MKNGLVLLILYGCCAAVWLARCGLALSRSGGTVDGLTVLAAIVWTAGFVVLLRRYLRNR